MGANGKHEPLSSLSTSQLAGTLALKAKTFSSSSSSSSSPSPSSSSASASVSSSSSFLMKKSSAIISNLHLNHKNFSSTPEIISEKDSSTCIKETKKKQQQQLSSCSTSSLDKLKKEKAAAAAAPATTTTTTTTTSSTITTKTGIKNSGNSHSPKLNDHTKKILKGYKKLDQSLIKFNSKHNCLMKTNILRITLLPFLRTHNNNVHLNFPNSKSVIITCIQILTHWWKSLLASLREKTHPISSSDRAVYLECISRILSMKEWNLVPNNAQYKNLLTETLDYSIKKLDLKSVSLSLSAFIGKVFAYSFFHLPGVANALLFLLGVKQFTLENLVNNLYKNPRYVDSCKKLKESGSKMVHFFPQEVKSLAGYGGRSNVPRSEKKYINACFPPTHPVPGISDPRGLWVKRWSSFDSDIFCSFLRHYLHILSEFIVLNCSNSTELNHLPWNVVVASPGFLIILNHFYELIHHCASQRKIKNQQKEKDYNISFLSNSNNGNIQNGVSQGVLPVAINKIFKTIRDYLHNAYDENEVLLAPTIVKLFDQILQCYALHVSAYDYDIAGFILDISYEFMINVGQRNEYKSPVTLMLSIDWNFWLSAVQNMLTTENINSELKALSMIFNIWDLIPNYPFPTSSSEVPKWFINPQESIRFNISCWLLSIPVWKRYFCHWQPLVRCYFQRLVCWRLNGFALDEIVDSTVSEQDNIRRMIESRLMLSYECLGKLVTDSEEGYFKLPDMTSSSPLVNRKMIIVSTQLNTDNSNNSSCADIKSLMAPSIDVMSPLTVISSDRNGQIRKIHSFEIFDDAIYSSSTIVEKSLGSTKLTKKNGSASTLVNGIESALKFFKKTPSKSAEGNGNGNGNKYSEGSPTKSSTSSPERENKSGEDETTDDSELVKVPVIIKPKLILPEESTEETPRQPTQNVLSAVKLNVNCLTPPSNLSKSFSLLSISSRSSSPSVVSLSNSPPSSSTSINELITLSDLDSLDSKKMEDVDEQAAAIWSTPPPPELDKRAPDLERPLFKFQLVFTEDSIQSRLSMVNNRRIKFFKDTANHFPEFPRLPRFTFNGSSLTAQHRLGFIDSDISSDHDEDECDDDSDEFIYIKRNPTTSRLTFYDSENKFDNLRNWGLLGKSLNEWNLIVEEFEGFVENQLQDSPDRVGSLSKIIPLLTFESPNKVVNAY
ncbi:hypothetical protein PACTADRAFT_48856 [Pachysolen tannophilus NRRL Y-2460]|uniref:DUF1765-domain-containing protein n=1 Tax=Pachysolen tannophilus NRRL Y-2460 TaxID=669874 RepID=A0A1E4TZD0_PACTA|nr:hypothetical protein PACTADRAFT_48856 [Pachysolen tannophilus NRRL Y-2460]